MSSSYKLQIKQLVHRVSLGLKLRRSITELGFGLAICFFACSGLLVLLLPFDIDLSRLESLGIGAVVVVVLGCLCIRAWCSVEDKDAARYLDTRKDLKDEFQSALWFIELKNATPSEREEGFVNAHLQRAAKCAKSIHVRDVIPLSMPSTVITFVAAILLFLATWLGVTDVVIAKKNKLDIQNTVDSNSSEIAASYLEPINVTEIEEINDALEALQNDEVSYEAKKEALQKARQVLDQINMEALMTREGLSKLSKMLIEQEGYESVGRALEQGNLEEAITLLKEKQIELASLAKVDEELNMKDQQAGSTARGENIAPSELGDAARDLINEVGRPDPRNITRLIENIEQAQQDMESQEKANTAASRMEGTGERMGLAQTGAADYGGRSATSDQAEAGNGTPSPDAGNNDMSGGSLFRRGSLSEDEEGDDGSATGAPEGHAAALALEGRMTKRLDAILKLEKTKVNSDESMEGDDSAWEFQASKQGRARSKAIQELDGVVYDESEVMNSEFVSVEQKKSVQQYFLEIHEGNSK